MKNLIQMMSEIEPGFQSGTCCFLDVLRAKAGMSYDKFNRAVLDLADAGKIFLVQAFPAQLSPGEKRNYVTVGENTFAVAVVRKDQAQGMKRIIDTMLKIEPGALNQVPVLMTDIRKKVELPHDEFDRLMFKLAESEIIYMDRHAHPAQMTDRERDEFLVDHLGQVFVLATFRKDAAEKIAALDAPVAVQKDQPGRMPVEQITLAKQEPIEPLPIKQPKPKGGKRVGAGRPKGTKVVKDDAERLPTCIRLPRWMLTWLTLRGDAGKTIEQALIEKHGLTPPA